VFLVTSAAFWVLSRDYRKKFDLVKRIFFDCGPNLYNHGLHVAIELTVPDGARSSLADVAVAFCHALTE